MIQRIQTVFLFLSAVLAGFLFFIPIASFDLGNEIVNLSIFGVENHSGALLLLILAVLMLAVPFVTIFMYKKRELQLKLSLLNLYLNILFILLLAMFYVDNIQEKLSAETVVFAFGAYIPFINGLLSSLAGRWIKKDIELIKSIDRLR